MKIYCQSCGYLHKYSSEKPNFCSSCGSGLSVGTNPTSAKKTIESEEDVPETKQQLATNLEKLSFDYQDFSSKKTNKLGSLAGTFVGDDGQRVKSEPMPKAKRVTKKAFLEEFKREAGSLRAKESNE